MDIPEHATPIINDTAPTTRHHLPLPPTLPYSPGSVPFKRHLQHLSLSVVSATPDESWRTYLALHPSLRRYIPDNLFRSLLAHQLSNPHAKQSWVRGLALVKFARKCGVEARNLGQENLRNALRSGFDLVLRTKVSDLKQYVGDIKGLWTQVEESKDVPMDLRRGYLQFHIKQAKQTNGKKRERAARAADALRDIVETYGAQGIDREAGKIVSLYHGTNESTFVESLKLAAWCADQRMAVHDDTFLIMLRLHQLWIVQGLEALPKLHSIVPHISTSSPGSDFLNLVLADLEHRHRSPEERALDALANNGTAPSLTRSVLDSLASQDGNLEIAIDSLAQLLSKDAEVGAVVTSILNRLSQNPDSEALIRLARLLLERDTLRHLRLSHTSLLLRLLISALPSEDGYILCRKVYTVARTHGYRWLPFHRSYWHQLFRHAIHRTRRHLHFASRLYADLQADGLPLHRNDLLALIRTIGMSRSSSRPILFDRHIRDYLDSETFGIPDALIMALVQGLTTGNDSRDASLAVDMSRRIMQDRPLPITAAEILIPRLAASPDLYHMRQAVHLLESSPTAESYNHVIFSIIAHSRTDARAGQMSRTEALAQAVDVYKRMVNLGISATPRTVSLLLRSLIDARHTGFAMSVFEAAIKNRIQLKANAVGRLMVRLIIDDHLDQAAAVECQWRSLSPQIGSNQGQIYDRAIVGARVLLDTKRGIEVDLDQIARTTGWKSTAPFLRFIESLKPHPASVADVQMMGSDVGAEISRPAMLMNPDRPARPWIRSDNEARREFNGDSDSMVTTGIRSGIMT